MPGFGFDAGCRVGEAGVQAAVLPFEGEVCHAWREFRADGVEYAVGGGCELAAALSDAVDGVGTGQPVRVDFDNLNFSINNVDSLMDVTLDSNLSDFLIVNGSSIEFNTNGNYELTYEVKKL